MNLQNKIKSLQDKRGGINLTKVEDIKRLNEIVDGASRLPVENQECILFSIRAMLFTRNVIMRQLKNEGEQKLEVGST